MKLRVRLIKVFAVSLVVFSVLTGFQSSPVLAAGNGTTVGSLQLTATFVNISVYANFSDDDNGNNSASMEWREAGGTWKQGMTLTVDRRQTIYDYQYYNVGGVGQVGPNPWRNQWRGSVLGLQPDTQYEIRVTFIDSEGVVGTNPITATIKTRKDSFPLGTGNTYHVATNGNDSWPGTEAQPWATMGKAISSVSPGDTVYFKGGTYNENSLVMTRSGTASNYITLMNYGTDSVVFNGGNATEILRLDGACYVKIHGFTFTNAAHYLVRLVHSANYNVIENCTWYDFGYMVPDGGICITLRSAYNVIQYNYIYNTPNRSGYGDVLHRASGISNGYYCGIGQDMYGPGEGNIYRWNRIQGTRDGSLGHGMTGEEHDDIQNGLYKDCDVYGNEISNVNADGIGAEAGDINCRVWGNKLNSCYTDGIGWGPCKIGPLYVYRNLIYDPVNAINQCAFKVGWGPVGADNTGDYGGRVYVYHNTISFPTVGSEFGVAQFGGLYESNQVYMNNIISLGRHVVVLPDHASNFTFDYDNLYNGGWIEFFTWQTATYPNLASVQSSLGQELHGISADPQFVNPNSGDFTLQSTSPSIDKGVIIPGFNDANSPWPYKGSAPDIGCFEYPTYRLSLDVTPKGITTTPIRGDSWYTAGTAVPIGPAPEAAPSGAGTRYAFSRWIVDGVERTGNPISVIMDSPHQVTAQYEIQYYLSVGSEYGSLPATGWYMAGTVVSIGPAPEGIPGNAGTRYAFSRWIVDGVERTDTPISITMDSPHKATAQYETQYYLSVESEYGNPRGSGWYYSKSTAEFSVPVVAGIIARHLFTGWSEDSTAATPAASIIMDGPKTVIANWRTDYSRLYIVIGIVAVLIGVISVVVARRRKKVPSL